MIESGAEGANSKSISKQKTTISISWAIIILLVALAIVGSYLLLKRSQYGDSDQQAIAPMKTAAELSTVDQATEKTGTVSDQSASLPSKSYAEKYAGDDNDYEEQRRMVMDKIRDFEEDAISRTHTAHIRVETPSIMAWLRSDPDAFAPEKAFRAHGYIAFAPAPEAFKDDVYYTMEDIAESYFFAFPEAPSVKVSLIIGNGVRGQETFRNENVLD